MIIIEKDTEFGLPENYNREKLISWLHSCAKKFQIKINQLSISFLDDNGLQQINNEVFNRNYLTDTITLSYRESEGIFSGEIYISLQRVESNARKYHTTYLKELLRVVIHSFLHVIGYEDKTEEQKRRMKCLEDWCLEYYS